MFVSAFSLIEGLAERKNKKWSEKIKYKIYFFENKSYLLKISKLPMNRDVDCFNGLLEEVVVDSMLIGFVMVVSRFNLVER